MIFRHLAGLFSKHSRIPNGAQESLSSTNLREIDPYRRVYSPSHVVVTLDPKKFAEKKQKRFHIGDKQSFTPYVVGHDQSNLVKGPLLLYDKAGAPGSWISSSYPTDTKAFLYYFTSPEKPRIAGGLRLRVTSSDDPTSFESGSDLLGLNGHPWWRPLHAVVKFYAPLYEKLRDDRLVPDDLDAVLSTFQSRYPRCYQSQLPCTLNTLNDTFIVDFSRDPPNFIVITEQGTESLPLNQFFRETRAMRTSAPYTGTALARFERSTLPDHNGTRTVVLRYLKIITPVKCVIPFYDGYIRQPKEGELYRRSRIRQARGTVILDDQPVWSLNIDKLAKSTSPRVRGLQLLWDT